MSDVVQAVVADAANAEAETQAEARIAVAQIEADRDVAVAEITASVASDAIEAQTEEDELLWLRDLLEGQSAALVNLQTNLAEHRQTMEPLAPLLVTMTEQMAELLTLLRPSPPNPNETVSDGERVAGPPENPEGVVPPQEEPAPRPATRRRNWL
jgi:hypothetical protein